MDTSLFDNIYTLWSEKVPQIMRNTIKNDFFLKNDVFCVGLMRKLSSNTGLILY